MILECRVFGCFILVISGCVLMPVGISWHIDNVMRRLGVHGESPVDMPLTQAVLVSGVVSILCGFFILLISNRLLKLRLSVAKLAVFALVALGYACFSEMASVLFGEKPYDAFLDGFAQRVGHDDIRRRTLNWADKLLADHFLNFNGQTSLRVPQDMIPSFLTYPFANAGSVRATVDRGHNPTLTDSIEVSVGDGIQWGLKIFRNDEPEPEQGYGLASRQVSPGVFVYYYAEP